MAFGLRWSGSGAFFATEIRVQLHEWLAILTGTLTPGALIVFVAILANLFGILPPVFYRFSSVPVAWRSVVLVLPTSAAAVLVNGTAGLETVTPPEAILAAVSLAVEAIALFVFGIYWARRMARER